MVAINWLFMVFNLVVLAWFTYLVCAGNWWMIPFVVGSFWWHTKIVEQLGVG